MNKKAIIAMSGGVDSSVAAMLMLEQGYSCSGVTMKLLTKKILLSAAKVNAVITTISKMHVKSAPA